MTTETPAETPLDVGAGAVDEIEAEIGRRRERATYLEGLVDQQAHELGEAAGEIIDLSVEVARLQIEKAGVEGERDAADDFAKSIRELLGVPDAEGWGYEVQEKIGSLLRAGQRPQVHGPKEVDRLASLFRSAPGGKRLGDEPPGVIARVILDAGWRPVPAETALDVLRERLRRVAEKIPHASPKELLPYEYWRGYRKAIDEMIDCCTELLARSDDRG